MNDPVSYPAPSGAARAPRALWTPWTHHFTEVAIVGLWFWTTVVTFRGDTLVLYALTAYFMAGCYIHLKQVFPVAKIGWVLLLLPIWASLSMIWSAAPAVSLKNGLQLILSVLVCYYVVARLSRRDVIVAIFFALAWFTFISLPLLKNPYAYGIFTEKNLLASRMSLMAFAAFTIFLDRGYPTLLRWAALPMAGLAFLLVALAQSATAMIAGMVGMAIIGAFALIWRPAKGYRALLVLSAITCALLAMLAITMLSGGVDPVDAIFSAFGKDKTITGRTELWQFAQQMIAKKPMLGVGSGAFWREGVLEAQTLLDINFKPRNAHFSFHNSYYETAVNIGLIGLALGLCGFVWTIWVNLRQFFIDAPVPIAFFSAMTFAALMRSFVEADLWRQFELVQMIVWIGALYAARDLANRAALRQPAQPG